MTKEEIERLENSSKFKKGGLVKSSDVKTVLVVSGPNAGSIYKAVYKDKPVKKEGYVMQKEGKDEYNLWKQAFEEYNADDSNYHLSMGSSPCYAKVLFYHKRKLNENTPR